MTTVSRPSRLASASGSKLVVPQSTVTSSVAPCPASARDRLAVRPIALEDAVRDVDQRIERRSAQKAARERRRRGAIHIIVAEDRDLLAAHDRVRDALRGRRHVGEHVGVGHQRA